MLLPTLVAIAATIATTSRAEAPGSLFEGCEITSSEHGEIFVNCPDLLASASTGPLAAETMLQSALNGMRAAFKGPLIERRTETTLRSVQRPSVSYAAFAKADDKAPVMTGVFVVFPLADGVTMRVIGCAARTAAPQASKRCEAVLDSMALSLPPATVAAGPSEYGVSGTACMGRNLEVPKGCALPQPGRLECETAILSWRHVPPALNLSAVLGPLRAEYAKNGTMQESVVKCQIEGTAGECHVFTVKLGDGDTLHSMLGVAATRDQGVLVQCDSVRPLTASLPLPCAQVFSLQQAR